ncbi:hypothetical protein D1007_40038 [Hordeum vulgare]|nr:hypothetical protein D1007_40038 [Hordeum vulgare]
MARGNDEVSSSLRDNDDICNEDEDDDLTENLQEIGEILNRAKNNTYKRFQYVLAYFEKCNDLFINEQAKSEQLEHELDMAHQTFRDLRSSKGDLENTHGKLKEDFELLLLEFNGVKGELIKISKIHEELQSTHGKSLIATCSSHIVDDTCASNSTSCEESTLKENVELCAQLDLLTSNYGKLEESHENLSRTHEDPLISHNELKLAHESTVTKVKSCESHVNISTSTLNALLPCANPCNSSISHIISYHDEWFTLSCCFNHEVSTSTSPLVSIVDTNHVEKINELKAQVTSLKKHLEKCGDGHIYHSNKKKSKNKKMGQDQATNESNISCFKCKKVGHHVRSCPSKIRAYKDMLHGKRPQYQYRAQPHVEERPLCMITTAGWSKHDITITDPSTKLYVMD